MDRRIRAWSFPQAALRVETDARSAVFVRHQIVHNPRVVSDLARSGATFVEELDAVPDDAPVVFSAHGVATVVREQAEARGLPYVDATCLRQSRSRCNR
jgi:4-hydroxy-3-methylbut-2-enyl diphosphate reductase IspH